MPSPGEIKHITEPLGLGVRHDGYVYEGYKIPMYYDPLISKLIVWANTREEAIDRLKRALYNYKITGIKTSIKFLARILDCPDFIDGNYNTHFVEDNYDFLMEKRESVGHFEDVAVIAAFIDYIDKVEKLQPQKPMHELGNNWKNFGRKKNVLRL